MLDHTQLIGETHSFVIADETPFAFLLHPQSSNDQTPVLLSKARITPGLKLGDSTQATVYRDKDGRLVASLCTPLITLGQCALLNVKTIHDKGAWLDWGLEDDLWLPRREMGQPVEVGLSVLVFLFLDEKSGRLCASSKLHRHLNEYNQSTYTSAQAVDLIIYAKTEMGYKAVINNTHTGLLFKSEIFKPLHIGDKVSGYIKKVRDDDKIDLALQLHNQKSRHSLADEIIADLHAHGGISTLTDKSPAEQITQRFNVSKSVYKKTLGNLYKQQRIVIDKQKITLINEENENESNR